MKNTILILISLLFLTGCASLYDRKINKYREVIKESPFTERVWGTYKNGRDGQKKYEKIYKDGELDGIHTQWYEHGKKKDEISYKDGKRDGLTTGWYRNGEKEYEVNYKNGKKNGLETIWYFSGQKNTI